MSALPILFTSYYTELGGGEVDLLNLVQQIDRSRFEAHLLVPAEGQLSQRWRELGLTAHIRPYRGASTYFIPAIWGKFPLVHQLDEIIQQHQIKLIRADYHTLPMAVASAKRAHIPLIWMCMGWWFHPKWWQKNFFRDLDCILAHSEMIKRGFLGEPPFMSPERIEVFYPALDTQRFHPDINTMALRQELNIKAGMPIVVMLARFQDVKGHDVFQEMVKLVVREIPEAQFLVAGESLHGSENAYQVQILKQHQQDPILREHITYLGFRSDSEQILSLADVVVCPSRFESFGMVNIEAQACGKPVVSTNQGGPSETVVDRVTGFLIEPRDVSGFAKRVIQLLRDERLHRQMGQAGRERAERLFAIERNVERFGEIVGRMVE